MKDILLGVNIDHIATLRNARTDNFPDLISVANVFVSSVLSRKGSTGTPFLYKSCTESTQPFGYQNSDLKKLYLDKYQLQSRLSAPILTQYEYLNGGFPNFN